MRFLQEAFCSSNQQGEYWSLFSGGVGAFLPLPIFRAHSSHPGWRVISAVRANLVPGPPAEAVVDHPVCLSLFRVRAYSPLDSVAIAVAVVPSLSFAASLPRHDNPDLERHCRALQATWGLSKDVTSAPHTELPCRAFWRSHRAR